MRRHLLVLCLLAAELSYAIIGVGTQFATIVLEKVTPGNAYNIRKLRNIPYVVMNKGTEETEIIIEVVKPPQHAVKKGYEPIFDPTWLRVVPDKVKLKPGEKFDCDVILTIPDDPTLIGKHYEAGIYAHNIEGYWGTGTADRFFFSIGVEGPEAVQRAKKKKLLMALNFEVDPVTMYLVVPAGEKIDVMKKLNKTIKLVNKGGTKLVVRMESVSNEQGFEIPNDYEFTPSTGFISFNPLEYKVGKNTIKDTKMFIEIPGEEQYRGKQYMFVIKTVPVKPQLPVELYTRVYVTVQQ
jgi:hypothetical protein